MHERARRKRNVAVEMRLAQVNVLPEGEKRQAHGGHRPTAVTSVQYADRAPGSSVGNCLDQSRLRYQVQDILREIQLAEFLPHDKRELIQPTAADSDYTAHDRD